MKKFDVEYMSDNLQSNNRLIFTGNIFKQAWFRDLLRHTEPAPTWRGCSHEDPEGCYSDWDIIHSALGLLSLGHSDFENIDQYRADEFFPKALGISATPSKDILCQRTDKLALRKRTKLFSTTKRC